MSGWRVIADLDLCQAHQMCLLEAPEIFGFDRAVDKVVVRQEYPADEWRNAAHQSVVHCPAMALAIVEAPSEED